MEIHKEILRLSCLNQPDAEQALTLYVKGLHQGCFCPLKLLLSHPLVNTYLPLRVGALIPHGGTSVRV